MINEARDLSESVPSTGNARFLKHQPEERREAMLAAKQDFVSFLLGLHNYHFKDYAFMAMHEKNSENYMFLYYEWFHNSALFSKVELSYCPKLRTSGFTKAARSLSGNFFVVYAISYIAIK